MCGMHNGWRIYNSYNLWCGEFVHPEFCNNPVTNGEVNGNLYEFLHMGCSYMFRLIRDNGSNEKK